MEKNVEACLWMGNKGKANLSMKSKNGNRPKMGTDHPLMGTMVGSTFDRNNYRGRQLTRN